MGRGKFRKRKGGGGDAQKHDRGAEGGRSEGQQVNIKLT